MDKVKEKRTKRKDTTPGVAASNAYGINSDLYKAVIENALEGFIILDIKGNILDANEAFSRMNGYSRKELLSMKVYDLAPTKITSEDYARLIKGHISMGGASFETQHRCKDGRIIDVAVSSKYLDIGGGIFFSFHRDITEQKRKEKKDKRNLKHTREELKETEDRYRTLIELGNMIGEAVIMLQDVDGRDGMLVYVSDQWPNITGYSREELLNMSFFDLVSPEDREPCIERHRQKMSGKAIPDLIELSIIHKNGEKVQIEITSAVTIYKGQPANVVYIRDITKRKIMEKYLIDSEEKYRTLFEYLPVAIWEVDYSKFKDFKKSICPNGLKDFKKILKDKPDSVVASLEIPKLTWTNQAALDLYETNSLLEMRDTIHSYIKSNLKRLAYHREFLLSLDDKRDYLNREYTILTSKGNHKTVLSRTTTPPGHLNDLSKVFIIEIDITERKRAEEKLRRSSVMLRRLEKRTIATQEEERARIARDLHDQLGQELVHIRLEALRLVEQSTEYEDLNKKTLALADMITESAKTVQRISLDLRPQLLRRIGIVQAVQLYAEDFERRTGISCPVNVSGNTENIKITEETSTAVMRIIQEALTNVIKHAKTQFVQISIFCKDNRSIIKIKDNGEGFNKIKLGNANSMGLLGMRERTRIIGGTLRINSRLQKGTTISLTLPTKL